MTVDPDNPYAIAYRATLRPACAACGHYLLPCTATPSGVHATILAEPNRKD